MRNTPQTSMYSFVHVTKAIFLDSKILDQMQIARAKCLYITIHMKLLCVS